MARAELHIQLYVRYMDDAKLESVSRSARLLYVDATCKARELLTDGFVSDIQLVKLAHPETPGKARKLAAELVASGAWEKHEGGYVIGAFLKRNPSKSDVMAAADEASEAGTRGNHERWHKGRISPSCPLCPPLEPPPDDADPYRVGVGVPDAYPIGSASGSDRVSIAIDRDRDKDKNPPNPPQAGGRRCTRHKTRPRRGCEDCAMPANPTVIGPPCGQCSPSRRLEDDQGDDLGPCPNCHPSRRTA